MKKDRSARSGGVSVTARRSSVPYQQQNSATAFAGSRASLDHEFQALVRSRYSGNPQAMTALGARLMVGRDAPLAPADGAALIAEAARQQDAAAWRYMSVLAAAGVGREQNWADAFAALSHAASLGDPVATRQSQVLNEAGLRGVEDLTAWFAPLTGRTLCAAPRLVVYADFLTPSLCSYMKSRAAENLVPAQVYDAYGRGLKLDPMRTNTTVAFSLIDTDLVIQLLRARIARTTGVAAATLEPTEVLHYAVGETFRPHVDFFHPSLPDFNEEIGSKGQRVRTFLIYLNDDLDGGETSFPKIGVKFRGRLGEALMFENVRANGTGDPRTLHAGLAPARGEKWLLSQWIRNKAQPLA